jgi:hypothetical protein
LTPSFWFLQVEAFTQFFLGYYEEDMTYCDDFIVLLKRNLSSVAGFWFDSVTSIPWSYMDLHFYLVGIAAPVDSCADSKACISVLVGARSDCHCVVIGAAELHCGSGCCRDDKQQRKGDTGGEGPSYFAGRAHPQARQIRDVSFVRESGGSVPTAP